jgi:hypothetical protein
MTRELKTMGELMREEEDRLIAAANSPEGLGEPETDEPEDEDEEDEEDSE